MRSEIRCLAVNAVITVVKYFIVGFFFVMVRPYYTSLTVKNFLPYKYTRINTF